MSFAVVGGTHKNTDGTSRMDEIFRCDPGELVDLVPEPENKFDRHAIAVFSSRAVQIGYISAERAPRLGSLLGSTEVHAVFQRPTSFGAWIRLAFDGEVPVLSEAMLEEHEPIDQPRHNEPDFYPDEVWPDD
jgi:hypothetical protein